jgi:hypothetical protein
LSVSTFRVDPRHRTCRGVEHAVIHIPNVVDDRWLPSRKASPRSTAMAVPNLPPGFINSIKHWEVEY